MLGWYAVTYEKYLLARAWLNRSGDGSLSLSLVLPTTMQIQMSLVFYNILKMGPDRYFERKKHLKALFLTYALLPRGDSRYMATTSITPPIIHVYTSMAKSVWQLGNAIAQWN